MKPLFFVSLLIVSFWGCQKKKESPVENEGIVGKWKLTESLSDPGDGSGKWQPADPAHPKYVEFRADGGVLATEGYPIGYLLVSDSTMTLRFLGGDSLPYRYKLTATRLTLNPPCIEACGLHYARVW